MPQIVDIMMQYLAVVVGEIEEIEQIVPDVFTLYAINSTDLNTNITLYSRFEDNGILLHHNKYRIWFSIFGSVI